MEFFIKLFDTADFPARWTCGRWSPGHGWLHVLSDLGVWSADFAIPVVLGYFLARRKDLPFRSVFVLFAAFIVLCGTTHLIEAVSFWWPAYRLAGVVKLLTAVVSWITVFALVRVAPTVLAMRSPEELEREIVARKEAEQRLEQANEQRDRQVSERTGALAAAVAELRAERELLSTTLASIGDAVITTDTTGRVTGLNPVAESLTGWAAADAVGQPLDTVFLIVNETTHQPLENPVTKALREGAIVGLANHTILIAKDGTERLIDVSAAPIRHKEGAVVGCVLVFRDISERKRAEMQLREQTATLRAVTDTTTDLIFVKDRDCRLTFANPATLSVLGLTDQQAIGRDAREIYANPSEGERITADDRRIMAAGVSETVEEVFTGPHGTRTFLSTKTPLRDGDGAIVGIVGISQNITDRKRMEIDLREREAFIGGILGSITDGIFVVGKDWQFTFANEEIVRRFGRRREEIIGINIWEMFPAAVGNEAHSGMHRAMANRMPVEYEVYYEPWQRWFLDKAFPTDDGGLAVYSRDITEHKRAVEQLHQSEANERQRAAELDAVLAAVPACVWIAHDPACKRITGNPASFALLRLSTPANQSLSAPDGERPTHFKVFKDGVELALDQLPVQVAATGVEVRDFEEEVVFNDGVRLHLFGHATPLRDETGRVRGSVAAFVDITARKQTETLLAGQRQVLEMVATGIPLADVLAATCRVIEQHEPGLLCSVLLPDERGRHIGMAVGPSLPDGHIHGLVGLGWGQPYIESCGEGLDCREAVVVPDVEADERFAPEWRALLLSHGLRAFRSVPVFGSGGTVLASFAVYRREPGDPAPANAELIQTATHLAGIAVEKRRSEAEREATQRTLAVLVEQCPFGIYIVDSDFKIASINADSQERAFRNFRPAVGRSFEEAMRVLWPEPVAADIISSFRRTLDTGEPYYSRDFVNPRADTNETEGYEWEVHRITLPDGRPGVVCYYFDATKLRQVEQELKDADRKKDEFLATLAHELRNPLAPIRSGLQIMKLARGDAALAEKSIGMMERQVGQMAHLIDDLMDLSRISRGKIVLQKTKLRLDEVLQDAVDIARPLIDERGHHLAVEMPPEPLCVDGDRTRLAQVFGNILNNAAKYTENEGRLRLAVQRQGSDVVVNIEDNGVGIPPHLLTSVFDMFSQIDRSLEKSQGGLGIGLNIVKKLVEMHEGSITAESDGQGLGSRFVVRLPVMLALTSEEPAEGDGETAKPAVRRRILIADDNRDAASSLAMLLRIMGNETKTAHDGPEALEAGSAFKPDVVLLDIGMPKMNGLDTCRRIRQEPWGKDITIVACTGWGQEDDRRRSQEAGFNFHLVKPIDSIVLSKVLSEVQAHSG